MLPMILERASKTDLIRQFATLSLERILDNRYPSLAALSRQYEPKVVENALCVIVQDLSATFNGELDTDDVQEIAVEIANSDLRNLSLEDMYLVCRQLKSNAMFGKLKVNTVLAAATAHFSERCNLAATRSLNQHRAQQFYEPRENNKDIEKAKYEVFKAAVRQEAVKNKAHAK